jgi:hypothetical protein
MLLIAMPRITLTLENDEQYTRWLAEVNKAGHGQSKWICAMVERSLENPQDFSAAQEIQNLREEINKLKTEKELFLTALQKERSERFKLESRPKLEGQSLSVAKILRHGGHWTQRQLLEALGIDPVDVEAMQIVRQQLETLVDAGFVRESLGSWRWME